MRAEPLHDRGGFFGVPVRGANRKRFTRERRSVAGAKSQRSDHGQFHRAIARLQIVTQSYG